MISDMDIKSVWPILTLGIMIEVAWKVKVENIEAYMAGPNVRQVLCDMMPILKKNKFVFCYDLTLKDHSGQFLKVLLSPMLSSFQRGQIKVGSFIEVKAIQRITVNGQFLVICEWATTRQFDIKPDSDWINLCDYRSKNRLLCSDDNNKLSPWTLQFFLWVRNENINRTQSYPVYEYDETKNLKRLDEVWTSLNVKWQLSVRVLAKSKIRVILQPENLRKPWISLCNLLVADCSAYCVITVWDEAVQELCQSISEGDILFLNKCYKVGRFKNTKTSYRLQPKKRLGLSPTEIEIKLNQSDLKNVIVSTSSAALKIPPPIWNFKTSLELTKETLPHGSIIDIVGIVSYYGRWEREQCFDDFHKSTGQFWVRLWLDLVDHLTDNAIKVKLYVSSANWQSLGEQS